MTSDAGLVMIPHRHLFDPFQRSGNEGFPIQIPLGVDHLTQRASASTDAIINDSFDGTNPTGLLLTSENIAQAKRCLTPGGLYLLNAVVDENDTTQAVDAAMRALAEHFAYVYEIPCIDLEFSGADNYLVIASDNPCFFSGVQSMLCS